METHSGGASARRVEMVAIALVSLAGLLLEVAYTRVVSFKLWYYYTYLVIGLALLGIGSGGIAVAIWPPLKRASTRQIVGVCSILGSVSIAAGFLVVALVKVDTGRIWDYGSRGSFFNIAKLGLVSFALFATFIAIGIVVATVLGRAGDRMGRLYFADLASAGLACVLAIPLISWFDPPTVIVLAALVCAGLGVWALPRRASLLGALGGAVVALLLVAKLMSPDLLPLIRTESGKIDPKRVASASEWGPVFRVDVMQWKADAALLLHDGTYGSAMMEWDGDVSSLGRYDTDARAIPFATLGEPPERELIIGSAGGNEILASLYFDAPNIEAVELNPVTVSFLTGEFADWTGHLPERPEVHLTQGDGRTYLARSDKAYDLIWYVAPDSYAANNAASSGAFVLSESYLYTSDMIAESLRHLSDDGIMVVQFGELSYDLQPNRTARYVVTARHAMEKLGIDDPSRHMLIAVERSGGTGDLSTIILKRTSVTDAEAQAFTSVVKPLKGSAVVHAPGTPPTGELVSRLASGTGSEVSALVDAHPAQIGAITDDAPFFWHFTEFRSVLRHLLERVDARDPEIFIGERVLVLLLGIAMSYAAVFLFLPFLTVRKKWRAFPAKGVSAAYFAALGLGFMLFEVTMIQRLVRFLGYPTYSLTVTLAAILVSTGVGALLSRRFAESPRRAMPALLAILALLAAFYRFGLDGITDSLQEQALGIRVLVAVVALLPLGLCLGMFMPLGLGQVSRLGGDGEAYVAWSWAVNGFFSVIGSVLTTILSMALGFNLVQLLALAVYAFAVLSFMRLHATATGIAVSESRERADAPAEVSVAPS